jgi:hypothetical protein
MGKTDLQTTTQNEITKLRNWKILPLFYGSMKIEEEILSREESYRLEGKIQLREIAKFVSFPGAPKMEENAVERINCP